VKTSTQLKAKARNLSAATNKPPHIIQRNYFLERFLERVSLSIYKDIIVLKGGVLMASLFGIEARATVDLDATMRMQTLSADEVAGIIGVVLSTVVNDNVVFTLSSVEETRVEAQYPGFRITLIVALDRLRDTVKIDLTAGDVITPKPVEYGYGLMFEDRYIRVLAYNTETVLAEKFTALLSLDVTNTRMKDFYDIYMLVSNDNKPVDPAVFAEAVNNTAKQRSISNLLSQAAHIVDTVAGNDAMIEHWRRYQLVYKYAAGVSFCDVIASLRLLSDWCGRAY